MHPNTGAISSNLSSLIIGNNSGTLKDNTAATKPAGIVHVCGRSWKITKTNFADPFSVEVKWDSAGTFNINHIRLLVSSSPDFSGAVAYAAPDVTISLGSVIVSGIGNIVPNNATSYITIGSADAFTTLGANTLLPLEMISFTAGIINNNRVELNWQQGLKST